MLAGPVPRMARPTPIVLPGAPSTLTSLPDPFPSTQATRHHPPPARLHPRPLAEILRTPIPRGSALTQTHPLHPRPFQPAAQANPNPARLTLRTLHHPAPACCTLQSSPLPCLKSKRPQLQRKSCPTPLRSPVEHATSHRRSAAPTAFTPESPSPGPTAVQHKPSPTPPGSPFEHATSHRPTRCTHGLYTRIPFPGSDRRLAEAKPNPTRLTLRTIHHPAPAAAPCNPALSQASSPRGTSTRASRARPLSALPSNTPPATALPAAPTAFTPASPPWVQPPSSKSRV